MTTQTNVYDLLRRVLREGEWYRERRQEAICTPDFPLPPNTIFKEARAYLDSLEQGPEWVEIDGRMYDPSPKCSHGWIDRFPRPCPDCRLDSLEARMEKREQVKHPCNAPSCTYCRLDETMRQMPAYLAPPSNTQHPSRPHHPVQRPSNKKDKDG